MGSAHTRRFRFSLGKDASGKSPWMVANSKNPNPAVPTKPQTTKGWWQNRG